MVPAGSRGGSHGLTGLSRTLAAVQQRRVQLQRLTGDRGPAEVRLGAPFIFNKRNIDNFNF